MEKKEYDEMMAGFPEYVPGGEFKGTREYWEGVFQLEDNRDPKLHEAFSELHKKIVDEVIMFCKEHDLNVDAVGIDIDGILPSKKFGEWTCATDSSMSMYEIKYGEEGLSYVDYKGKPLLYEI